MRNEESYGANKMTFILLKQCTPTVVFNAFCFSPDGVLRLQTEEEALCECLDVVDTMEMILCQVHCQVACIK